MKILAALKKIKHLDRKIENVLKRISKYCSVIVDNENDDAPVYNADDIQKMQQKVVDWAVEKVKIRTALHLTNVRTKVDWMDGNYSIDNLLLIQNVLMPAQMKTLTALRRKEKGGYGNSSSKDSWVIMQYDPKKRDAAIEKAEHSKELLDELLDNLNIETDVVGLD